MAASVQNDARMKTICSSLNITVLFVSLGCASVIADDLKPIDLPAVRKSGGKPFMETVAERRTTREIGSQKLPLTALGNLLWSAFGVNRPDTAHRTAPSAMNAQEVDLYVALPDALYVYNAKDHQLVPVLAGDFRPKTNGQDFARNAPAVLILVADFDRMVKAKADMRAIEQALNLYRLDSGIYPTTEQGLGALVEEPRTGEPPRNYRPDGYMERVPLDPWNHEFLYASDGKTYTLNLIDTPGHVDFTYEVSRSLAACEGVLLVVDAAQGVEAQTVANALMAMNANLEIIPLINKIDLPSADPERVKQQIEQVIGIDAFSNGIRVERAIQDCTCFKVFQRAARTRSMACASGPGLILKR